MSRHGKLLAATLAAVLASALAGCSPSNSSSDAKTRLFRSEAVKAVSAGLDETHASSAGQLAQKTALEENRFAFKLYTQLLTQNPGRNIALSPFATASELYMLNNGATGPTKDAFYEGLGLETFAAEEADNGNAEILSVLKSAGSSSGLSIATSIWAPKGTEFLQPFTVRNKLFYGIDIFNLDFENRDASSSIDDWFSWRSKGKIEEESEAIEPASAMYLENVATFDSVWCEGFEDSRTAEASFHLSSGDEKPATMLGKTARFKYLENDTFTSAALPLGNGQFSFYIFLPKETSSLESFFGILTLENWVNWMKGFEEAYGTVRLPKFTADSDLDLTGSLAELGMTLPFEPDADFSAMASSSVYIKRLRQHAFVKVSETAKKKAKAPEFETDRNLLTADFTVDRPFFFAVKDEKTGVILLMGSQVDI